MGTTPYDRFQTDTTIARKLWKINNRNFGSAYERAVTSYLDTIKMQESADRAAAERRGMLVMLAFSLAGGSALASLFGKAASKAVAADLAKDAAPKLTVEKGWNQTFMGARPSTRARGLLYLITVTFASARSPAPFQRAK